MSAIVEVTRGDRVESRHRGAVVVADADGGVRLALGAGDRPVFPRSAVKLIQALPLIETGAADRFGLTVEEIAIAGASHNGEPDHAVTVGAMLDKAGRHPDELECGPQWPERLVDAAAVLAEFGAACPIHNNCSGKHAGFLCVASAIGVEPRGYVAADHPVQRLVTAALAEVTRTPLDPAEAGIDGCSIPTYAIPLEALAAGFARMATGIGLAPGRAAAAARLRAAAAAAPFMVAGSGRFCTRVMARFGARIYVKTGAEGVFCAALPDEGLGIAVKVEDGATRAAEALVAAVLARFAARDDAEHHFLAQWSARPLTNRRDLDVGEVRLAAETAARLAAA